MSTPCGKMGRLLNNKPYDDVSLGFVKGKVSEFPGNANPTSDFK
jgi:hypothetical protein